MIPWTELGRAEMPGGGGELRLTRRGDEFSIMAGAIELMNSRRWGSEAALASLALARLGPRPAPRILIGGLGMGFTLRAIQAELDAAGAGGAGARITVAELVPEVAAWARGPMAALHGDSLEDARLTVAEADVAALIGGDRAAWDVILLDVDNGPEGLTRRANDALYSPAGLAAAHAALAEGGVLAVWSAWSEAAFTRRLRQAGFSAEEHKVRARPGKGSHHVVWIAARS